MLLKICPAVVCVAKSSACVLGVSAEYPSSLQKARCVPSSKTEGGQLLWFGGTSPAGIGMRHWRERYRGVGGREQDSGWEEAGGKSIKEPLKEGGAEAGYMVEPTRTGLLTSVAFPLTYAGWDCGRGSASSSVIQLAWRSSSLSFSSEGGRQRKLRRRERSRKKGRGKEDGREGWGGGEGGKS